MPAPTGTGNARAGRTENGEFEPLSDRTPEIPAPETATLTDTVTLTIPASASDSFLNSKAHPERIARFAS